MTHLEYLERHREYYRIHREQELERANLYHKRKAFC